MRCVCIEDALNYICFFHSKTGKAERAEALAAAAEKAFRDFDTNKDGEISMAELKAGLEKTLK
eukprot:11572052-Ditylum_brightwellii.AAC.1